MRPAVWAWLSAGCCPLVNAGALAAEAGPEKPLPGIVLDYARPFDPAPEGSRYQLWIGGPDNEIGPLHHYRAWRWRPLRGYHRPNNDARYIPLQRFGPER